MSVQDLTTGDPVRVVKGSVVVTGVVGIILEGPLGPETRGSTLFSTEETRKRSLGSRTLTRPVFTPRGVSTPLSWFKGLGSLRVGDEFCVGVR